MKNEDGKPYLMRRNTGCKNIFRSLMLPFFEHAKMDSSEQDEFMDILYHRHVVEDFAYHDDAYMYALTNWIRDKIVPHKIAVFDAGMELLGIPALAEKIRYKDEFIWNLKAHDMSKLCFVELLGYYLKFSPDSNKADEWNIECWNQAWNHHKHHNEHHPEHWLSVGREGKVNHVLKMPEIFVFEMIADWMGASKTYGGNFIDWTLKNFGEFQFHPDTRMLGIAILARMGFGHPNTPWPKMDGDRA